MYDGHFPPSDVDNLQAQAGTCSVDGTRGPDRHVRQPTGYRPGISGKRCQGQAHREYRPSTLRRGDPNRTAMSSNNLSRRVQAQAETWRHVRRLWSAISHLKQPIASLG